MGAKVLSITSTTGWQSVNLRLPTAVGFGSLGSTGSHVRLEGLAEFLANRWLAPD